MTTLATIKTYEHWHEADRRALEMMRLIVAKIDSDPSLIQIDVENSALDESPGQRPKTISLHTGFFFERIRFRMACLQIS